MTFLGATTVLRGRGEWESENHQLLRCLDIHKPVDAAQSCLVVAFTRGGLSRRHYIGDAS